MKVERIYLKDEFPQLGEDCGASVDCYIPMQMEEMGVEFIHPCLVVCPGGGYAMTSEREGEPIALNFLNDGYAAFVIHYSVAPKCFPQQLLEVAAVMELIHKNAKAWHCDADDIAIIGFSAGGHLAAQYSIRYDCPEVRAVFPESKPVQKAILGYPVITGNSQYTHRDTRNNFVGHETAETDEKGFSCELRVTEKTPPTFIWHTVADAAVPVENSLLYAMALSAHKVPYELHIYPYGEHGLATVDEWTNVNLPREYAYCHSWMKDCKKWLKLEKNIERN